MKEQAKSGIGFSGLLQLLFIALKLTDTIHWSWKWVLSPTWIPMIIAVLCISLWIAVQED